MLGGKMKALLVGLLPAAVLAAAPLANASTVTYGLQFAPTLYTPYTGWASGVQVASFTAPAFNSVNTTTYTLGSASFAINGNNYNIQNGITTGTPTTDIQWLNTAFFFGNGSTPLTATLSGVSASATVDFQFIESFQTGNEPSVTISPASGNAQPIAISTDTSFTDAGSYTGSTSYSLAFVNNAGGSGEFDLSGALITITSAGASAVPIPATASLVAVGAVALLALRRRSVRSPVV